MLKIGPACGFPDFLDISQQGPVVSLPGTFHRPSSCGSYSPLSISMASLGVLHEFSSCSDLAFQNGFGGRKTLLVGR